VTSETKTPDSKTLDVPRGQWADLLTRIDTKKHDIAGNWKLQDGQLSVAPQKGLAALLLPVVPRGAYDVEIEFTRTGGEGLFGLILPVGPQQCLAAMDCRPGIHGLDMIDGRRADNNQSSSRGALTTGRTYRLNVSVSADDTEASITVNLDDRPLFFYRGPVAALALHKDFKTAQPKAPALVARCSLTLKTLKLRMKSGDALLLP
jgi:hypothetical protein